MLSRADTVSVAVCFDRGLKLFTVAVDSSCLLWPWAQAFCCCRGAQAVTLVVSTSRLPLLYAQTVCCCRGLKLFVLAVGSTCCFGRDHKRFSVTVDSSFFAGPWTQTGVMLPWTQTVCFGCVMLPWTRTVCFGRGIKLLLWS